MTSRPGVAGREIVSELGGNIELGPYDPTRVDNDGVNANARTLETFLGSVVKRFDVNTADNHRLGRTCGTGQTVDNSRFGAAGAYVLVRAPG